MDLIGKYLPGYTPISLIDCHLKTIQYFWLRPLAETPLYKFIPMAICYNQKDYVNINVTFWQKRCHFE